MTKNIKLSTIATIAVITMIGCGSSGSTTSSNTGTGFYVDNAVAGVKYVCGSETGTTDSKGTFTFEEGQECKFSLAGIPLRTTPSDELKDGQEVFEDNPKVAKFLQSIDANNDLSDGIQITDEVLTALTGALKTANSTGKLPEDTILTEVVASVGHDITAVTGDVRTDTQVQAHLAKTQTEITKALLAGKTFYVVKKEGHDKTYKLFKMSINTEANTVLYSALDGTEANERVLTIVGNKFIFTNDEGTKESVVSQKDGYILIGDSRNYASKSDAQAYFDSVKGETEPVSNDNNLKFTTEYLSGKTLATIKEKDNGKVSGCWIFNQDKSINVIYKKSGVKKEAHLANANWHIIDNDKLTFITEGTDYQTWEITEQNGDLYTFTNKWYDGDGKLDDTDDTRKIKEVTTCPLFELIDD